MEHSRRDIGDRLRQERERLNLSQQAMAEAGDVSRKTQYSYESGESKLSVEYLIRVAVIGCDLVYVLTGVRPGAAESQQFASAANATLHAGDPGLSRKYIEAVVSHGVTVSEDEAAVVAKLRSLPAEQRESFMQILGVVSARRGSRPKSGARQVVRGDVGQAIQSKSVVTGDVIMGGVKAKGG